MPSKNLNLPLLGETLTRNYRLSCELYDTYPKGRFTHQLSHATLSLDLADLDGSHLEALCHTICNKLSPISIQVSISPAKDVGVKIIERMVEGISVCLALSLTLTTLNLHGIKLKGKVLDLLCQGLAKCRELKTLGLVNCWLGDSGTGQLCQAIKNVPSITHLALVNCRVSAHGAGAVACLIKHQKLNRDSAMWQDTLRHREPHLDGMRGLRRVTLNNNPQLGDTGVLTLTEALTEDLWIKALDIQNCGIGGEGGQALRTLVDSNQTLEVVDLRRNPFVPQNLPQELVTILDHRQNQYSQQYTWLEMTEDIQGGGAKESTGSYLDTGRVTTPAASRGRRPSFTATKKLPKAPSQLGIPWRVEHRLFERREGMTPGTMVDMVFSEHQENLTVNATSPAPQLTTKDAATQANMKKQLEQYKKRYQRERKKRKQMEGKLSHLKTQLKGKHLLDEQAVVQIEECFTVFQSFLAHVQKSGFQWQLSDLHSNLQGNIKPSGRQQKNKKHQPNHGLIPSTLSVNTDPIPSALSLSTSEGVDYVEDRRSQSPVSFTVPFVNHSKKYHGGKLLKASKVVHPMNAQSSHNVPSSKTVSKHKENKPVDLVNTQSSQKVLDSVSSSVNVPEYQVETNGEIMSRNGERRGKPRRSKVSIESKDAERPSDSIVIMKNQETVKKDKSIGGSNDIIKVQETIANYNHGAEIISETVAPRLPPDYKSNARSYEDEKEECESSDIPSLASSEIRNAISEGEIEFTGSEFDLHDDDEIGMENYKLLNQGTISAETRRNTDKDSNIEPAISKVESKPETYKGTHKNLHISSPSGRADLDNTTQTSEALHSLQINPPRRVDVENTQATIVRTIKNNPKPIQESMSRSSGQQVTDINTKKEHLEISKETTGIRSSNNLQATGPKTHKQHHEIGQNNGTSETDDEKLRNMHSSLLHLTARRGSMSSSSSFSITEQLSQSHSHWSRSTKRPPKQRSPDSPNNMQQSAESHQHKQRSPDSLQSLQRSPDILQNIQILNDPHDYLPKLAESPQNKQLSPNFQQNIQKLSDSHQIRSQNIESSQSVNLNKSGIYTTNITRGLRSDTTSAEGTKWSKKGSHELTQALTDDHGFLQSPLAYKFDKYSHSQASNAKYTDKQGAPISSQYVGEEDQENAHRDTVQAGNEGRVETASNADGEEEDYRSDFEQSEEDDESISVTSLTTTSIPEDLLTPGEEDF
ncbi:hypothetical protein Pcinc_039227 [Petrolisthes cinctipes]|uniref:Centrosomal protein of 78 kDa n=1 Tax=Petrolisthes cinctipes TaxID=88211 RepID=A0AAE1BP26_PETCI|nr:hypothetical protein Pcinc_039227 [Petrolisthes cinctipes]